MADPLVLLPLLLPLLPYVVVVPLLVMLLLLELRAAGCETGPTPRLAAARPGQATHTPAASCAGTKLAQLLLLVVQLPASEATSGPPLVQILWLRSPDPHPGAPTTACGTSRQVWAAALMLPMQGAVARWCASSADGRSS